MSSLCMYIFNYVNTQWPVDMIARWPPLGPTRIYFFAPLNVVLHRFYYSIFTFKLCHFNTTCATMALMFGNRFKISISTV